MSLLTDALSKSGPTTDDTAESAITELEDKLDISGELDESSRDPTVQTVALDELLLEEFEAARRKHDTSEVPVLDEAPAAQSPSDPGVTDVPSHDEVLASQSIVLEDLPEGTLDAEPEPLAILQDPPTLTDAEVEPDPTLVVMPDSELLAAKPRRKPLKRTIAALSIAVAVAAVAVYFYVQPGDDQFGDSSFESERPILTEPTSLSSLSPTGAKPTEAKPAVELTQETEAPAVVPPAVVPPPEPQRSSFTREPATTDDIRSFAARAKSIEPVPRPAIKIARTNRESPVYLALKKAYSQFRLGDFSAAGIHYQEAIDLDPNNVDALLGLAALAQREGEMTEAQNFYRMALSLDVKNSIAISGMMSLQAAGATVENESELKSMLAEQPQAAHLHFALGLQYVTQSRWPDAQQSFFEAARHDPANADYAYNLAVSLDQLGQRDAAASYYRRAVELANGAQKFELDVARKRLSTLAAGA